MIEINGGKLPGSNVYSYKIWANRGNKFWGVEMIEYIGKIIEGVIILDAPHTPQEADAIHKLWQVKSITEKF